MIASKRRARQEIASIFREWKKYGLKDVVVDKRRNIIFGRVDAKNREYLYCIELSTLC